MTGDQLSLDDLPAPTARATDPDTSHAAAADAKVTAGSMRAACLVWLERFDHLGGATDFELADATGRQQTSIGKRRGELRDAGLVIDSSLRRPAPSGSASAVWRITEAGRQLLRSLADHPSVTP